jgi:hypothetical protein
MVHMQEITGERDYLNIKKAEWKPPWSTENERHNDSFPERYFSAVEDGVQMLEALYGYIYGDVSPDFLAEKLGNRSLKTGENKCIAS